MRVRLRMRKGARARTRPGQGPGKTSSLNAQSVECGEAKVEVERKRI